MRSISRRTFLGCAGATALAPGAPGKPRALRKVNEFGYGQIALTGGPLASQYRRVHAFLLRLDNDRLLKVYRQRAGLPAPGEDMGGWYDANGFVPGHLIGQFISGLARFSAGSGDDAAAAKSRALVEGYAATLGPKNYPFASVKASTTWPCYILDKYEIGLLDAASLADSEPARALLPHVIDGAAPYIPDHVYDRGPNSPKQAPYDEPYILPENLFKTYELTGDRRYLDMAKKYLLDTDFFQPLAEGRNILPGKHAYSHVIALSSGAKAYELLGEEKYLRALRNAWDMLVQTQQYASGAWGPKEAFVQPHSGELGSSLAATHDHFETPCCYYAHSKLARYLLGFTGEARYGDGLEQVLLNTILGAVDPDDEGRFFYYSDYHAGAKKGYYKMKWPCCAGTLAQSVADYPINLYFHAADSIYVNLFTDSEVRWVVHGVPVTIVQRTAYPESETVELLPIPERPVEFTIAIRVPGWASKPVELSVNGKTSPAKPGAFARVRRTWKRGDRIQLSLPFSFRLQPVDDRNRQTVAVMRGPLMLVAVDPPANLTATAEALTSMKSVPRRPLEFDCATATGAVRFKPFYQVKDEAYTAYVQQI